MVAHAEKYAPTEGDLIKIFARGLLLAALLLIPAGRLSVVQIAGRTPDLFYVDIALLAIVLFRGLLVNDVLSLWRDGWRPLIIFSGVALFGGFMSADMTAYIGSLRPVVYALAIVSLVRRAVRNQADVTLVLAVISVSVALISIQLLLVTGFSGLMGVVGKEDVELEWGRSNYFGTFAVASIFSSWALALRAKQSVERWIGYMGAIAALVILILSKSRGAMFAFLFVLFVLAPLLSHFSTKQSRVIKSLPRWLTYPLVLLVSGLVLYFVYPYVLAAVGIDVDDFLDSGNLRRIDAWLSALHAFAGSPVVGIGWSNATVMVEQLTETATTTHSLPLQLLAETGVLGFICIVMTIRRSLKGHVDRAGIHVDSKLRNGLKLAVFAVLVHCSVEPSFWGVQFVVLFWTLLTILAISWSEPLSARCVAVRQARLTPTAHSSPLSIAASPDIDFAVKASRCLK